MNFFLTHDFNCLIMSTGVVVRILTCIFRRFLCLKGRESCFLRYVLREIYVFFYALQLLPFYLEFLSETTYYAKVILLESQFFCYWTCISVRLF